MVFRATIRGRPVAIVPDVGEAPAENPGQLQLVFGDEAADFLVPVVDQVAAGFGVLAVGKAVADGPDAAADAVARVEDGDMCAEIEEIVRRGQASQPGPGDDDRRPGQGRHLWFRDLTAKLHACLPSSHFSLVCTRIPSNWWTPNGWLRTLRTRTSGSSTCGRTATRRGTCPEASYRLPVAIRDAKAPPTFLPTPQAFADLMAKLGVGDSTRVVVYDERGGMYAARACGGS